MTSILPKILVYGYGNPGRQDDGLGIKLAEEMERWCAENHLSHVKTDTNYQLNLEDAATIAACEIVIFADASKEEINGFCFDRLEPSDKAEFTMHAVSPAFVLHLSKQIFRHEPEAYLLHIRGYDWGFMEEMTDRAKQNLAAATTYLKDFIQKAGKV